MGRREEGEKEGRKSERGKKGRKGERNLDIRCSKA